MASSVKQKHRIHLLYAIHTSASITDWMLIVSLQIAIFEATGKALSVMLIILAELLPMLALGPVAGMLSDKFPPKPVLVSSCLAKLTVVASAACLASEHHAHFLYVIAAAFSCATRFFNPAASALLPRVIDPHDLQKANATMMGLRTAGMAAGATLAGFLSSRTGGSGIWTSLFFLVSLTLFLCFLIPPLDKENHDSKRSTSAAPAFSLLHKHARRISLAILSSSLVTAALGAFEVSALPYVSNAFGQSKPDVGLLFGFYGAGMLLGFVISSSKTISMHARASMAAGVAITCLSMFFMSFISHFAISLAPIFMVGACEALVTTIALLDVYRKSPGHFHGTLLSWLDTANGAAFLTSVLFMGVMIDKHDVRNALFFFSISLSFVAATGIFIALLKGFSLFPAENADCNHEK